MKDSSDFLRELVHKSWHRGCKETDILLGQFARGVLSQMSPEFLDVYSKFIYEPDWDIYSWLTGEQEFPNEYVDVVEKIRMFHENKS